MPTVLLTAGQFALKHWQAFLGGGVALVLVIMLLFARHGEAHWHNKADSLQASLALETAKERTDIASIATCTAAITDQNAAVEKLKAEGDARQASAAKAISDAKTAAQGAEAKARGLEASAAQKRSGAACTGSQAYSDARRDL